MSSFTLKEFLMKKHFCLLTMVFAGLFAAFISSCERVPSTVVDTVTDPPPTTEIEPVAPPMQVVDTVTDPPPTTEIEPVVPPMQPVIDQSYTLHASLDHQSPIHAVAFSPNGQTFASLGDDSLKLWDPHTEQLRGTISLEASERSPVDSL